MVKFLLLLAIVANIFIFTSATEDYRDDDCDPIARRKPRKTYCNENEIWSTCPEAVCRPKTCDEVGFPVDCIDLPPNGQCPSKPGCICRENFVKDHRGICVPMEFCPSCGGDCNAKPGCGNCNPLCSNYDQKDIVCTQECRFNACDCKKGYVLDLTKKKCVEPSQCPPRKKCKKNEVYDFCPSPCPFRTCGINDAAVSCAPSLPLGHPDCPPPTCRCKDGFYRNHLGNCVPWKHCPKCKRPDEVYDPCPITCPPKRCDVDPALILCEIQPQLGDPKCKPSCRCADGFLRNGTGFCIPKADCPPKCGVNEVYTDCIPNDCKPESCSQLGKEIECPIRPAVCRQGCVCKDGHVRNGEGICIPIEKCPPRCPVNEEFSNCIQNKPVHSCSQLGFPINSTEIEAAYCKQGCVCKEGYVRDYKGYCIPAGKCPSCAGDINKVAGCGVYCNQRCSDIGKEPGGCILICYENACDCREGYYLDGNTGFCVPPKQCTPQCPENEFYSECTQANCSPEYCSQIGFPMSCPRVIQKYCKKGCLCKEGYARNDKGICIPRNKCPSCRGDKNARPGCGGYCNNRCSNIGKEPHSCPFSCEINGCDCKPGYYFDDIITKRCVKPEQCPLSLPMCGRNEEYSNCTNANYGPKTCKELGYPIPFIDVKPEDCIEGCRCIAGHVRNDKGICIPSDLCPSCGGDRNAKPGCGGNCNRHCSNIGKKPGLCALSCRINGCDCKDGYFYSDIKKRCVRPEECGQRCPANEVHVDCINGGCRAQNCSQYGKPVPCIKMDPKYCISGCACKENFLRNCYGQCVPAKSCPEACNGPNEEFHECAWNCPPQTCDSVDKAYACPIQTDQNCQPMCKCKPNYYRNKQGQCVTKQQCKPQCPKYERYETCPGASNYPQYCYELGFPLPYPDQNGTCSTNPVCVCIDGYVRDENRRCIPKNDCPSCGGDINSKPGCGVNCGKRCRDLGNGVRPCPKICYFNACDCIDGYYYDAKQKKCVLPGQCTDICDKNEVFEDCTNPTCKPETCSQVGFPLDCKKPCRKGCVCKYGYVRDANGKCILANQCPSCGGDKNSHLGCGTNCGKRCPNNYINPKFCPRIACTPQLNKCECNDGYFLDGYTKKCVKFENCSPRCNEKNYEEPDACVNGGCGWRNCSQVGGPILCIDPIKCYQGCRCKKGYYRLDDGKCVPECQCPKKCPGPNEYHDCGQECDNVCGEKENKHNCSKINIQCVSKCYCRDGFARNKQGICIPINQCPKKCPGPNEYHDCGQECDNVCGEKENKHNCSKINIQCVSKCYCRDGFARNKQGICIPINQCPKKCPGPNEYHDCGPICDNVCGKKENKYNCSKMNIKCVSKCYCRDGFARNKFGICIPVHQCPRYHYTPKENYEFDTYSSAFAYSEAESSVRT